MNKTIKQLHKEHKGKMTDKWAIYLEQWTQLFYVYRDKNIRLLEIGIQNGGSLEVWCEYFSNAERIIGCDIDERCNQLQYGDPRVSVVVGDANTDDCQQRVLQQSETFDIIVDDGSHKSSDIVRSFSRYFPVMNDGGVYVAEDLHCSYWKSFEGGIHDPYSSIAFFKRLADIINHEHWRNNKSRKDLLKEFSAHYDVSFDEHELASIHSIEFINSLCIIKKFQPEKNVLGERVITGVDECATTDWERFDSTSILDIKIDIVDDDPDVFELMESIDELTHLQEEKDLEIAKINQSLVDQEVESGRISHILTEQEIENSRLNHVVSMRDGEVADLNQLVAAHNEQIASLNFQLSAILNSRSWKITAGLRRIKHVAAYMVRSMRLLATGRTARLIFRKLPVSKGMKGNIKHVVYHYAGWLFRGTMSYHLWHELDQLKKANSSIQNIQKETSAIRDVTDENDNENKRLLIIDATTPTPDRDSGSLDVIFFMKAFIELGYKLTFIPDDLEPMGDYTENIRALGVHCLTHEDISSIEDFLIEQGSGLDVVLLYRVHSARLYAPNVKKYAPNAKIIFDTVDLHYLREERQAVFENSPEAIDCANYTKQAEFEMMRVADATIVLSSVEHDVVMDEDSSLNVFEIPYMRDMPGCSASYQDRRDIVFIGGFLHLPNIDAIKYFVKEIWPEVRAKLTDARLLILGSSPTHEVLALGGADSRIEVIGFVDDLDPYFNSCRVSIAPLRFGAGIKGKIGTSASYGVPCVATSVAVEGMGMRDMFEVLVADEPGLFSEKLVSLYDDEELWNKVSNNSFEFVQRNYSYKAGKARLKRLLNSLSMGTRSNEILDFTEIESLSEFKNYKLGRHDEYIRRDVLEKDAIGDPRGFALKGYCVVCRSDSSFHSDFEYAHIDAEGNKYPNWRERMVCAKCELNNRVRASIHLFQQECCPKKNSDIYVTEQTTALYAWVKDHYSSAVGSEYLGSTCPPGESNSKGIRNESLTALSFASNSFDYILSFDVLEHIPDYRVAIEECARILRPGGQMMFSVPFSFDSDQHIVRARMSSDGNIENLMEPEYHGDPINDAGCLCFYHFGWNLLNEFREAGFDSAGALFYWSDKFGYLGHDQALFIATKRVEVDQS